MTRPQDLNENRKTSSLSFSFGPHQTLMSMQRAVTDEIARPMRLEDLADTTYSAAIPTFAVCAAFHLVGVIFRKKDTPKFKNVMKNMPTPLPSLPSPAFHSLAAVLFLLFSHFPRLSLALPCLAFFLIPPSFSPPSVFLPLFLSLAWVCRGRAPPQGCARRLGDTNVMAWDLDLIVPDPRNAPKVGGCFGRPMGSRDHSGLSVALRRQHAQRRRSVADHPVALPIGGGIRRQPLAAAPTKPVSNCSLSQKSREPRAAPGPVRSPPSCVSCQGPNPLSSRGCLRSWGSPRLARTYGDCFFPAPPPELLFNCR